VLGEGDRAKARMNRALLIDPDNFSMRYNFGCALSLSLKDKESRARSAGQVFETITDKFLPYAKGDPDLELLRDDPRYQRWSPLPRRVSAPPGNSRKNNGVRDNFLPRE
jgi:adenylate cyclase